MRIAILTHQYGNVNANLIWGSPISIDEKFLLEKSCQGLRALDYFVSAFPEGDGLTIRHPNYSSEIALADICKNFLWLDIKDKCISLSNLYGNALIECKILVPVEKFHLTALIDLPPYKFIPALGCDENEDLHPWHDYFSDNDIHSIYQLREISRKNAHLGITSDEILLTYPLIETTVMIPHSELCLANEYPDGMNLLIKRCVECADRGLDLLRFNECSYKQLERLCSQAGQLLDGFHAVYVIPQDETIHIKSSLYCHLVSPFQVSPNWLGLDISEVNNFDMMMLAPIVYQITENEIHSRLRGAIRTASQAFYMITPESRFLSLIFGLDSLCAPKHEWSGLTHHSYIAAIAANGNISQFNKWLRFFDQTYKNVRNKLVHKGASFLEIEIDAARESENLILLFRSCVSHILISSFNTIAEFRSSLVSQLKTPEFQNVILKYIDENSCSEQDKNKLIQNLKWR